MNVALVDMPFAPADVPSPALGLLAAVLRRAGIGARVIPLKYDLVERLGPERYAWLGNHGLIGEWLFARALFGDAAPDRAALPRALGDEGGAPAAFLEDLGRMGAEAERFVDDALVAVDWGAFDAVGFTTSFCQLTPSLALARRLAERAPRLRVVLGGAACEAEMGEEIARRFPFVDAVFCGEAEASLPAALAGWNRGEPVPRVVPAAGPEPLDALPFPDYDDDFAARGGRSLGAAPVVPFEASRGCFRARRSQCVFCGLNGESTRYRRKSPERVVREVRDLARRYGPRLAATDNVLGGALRRPLMARLKEAAPGLCLFFETRADLARADVSAMADAGVRAIQPGIESLASGVLRLMRKGTAALDNVHLLKACYDEGVWPIYNVLVGTPGEDPADYRAMEDLVPRLAHLPPPAGILQVRLDRFSPLWLAPERFGLAHVEPMPAYAHIFPFPADVLRRIAYFFRYDYADGRDPWAYARPFAERVTRDWRPGRRLGGLRQVESDGGLVIVDDRDPRGRRIHRLEPPASLVYAACAEPRPVEAIAAALAGRAVLDAGATATLLGRFVEAGLALAEDGRYLALALAPVRPVAAAPRPGAGTYLI